MFAGLVNWIMGTGLALFAILGLFVAAHGGTHEAYYFGLGMALISLVAIGMIINGALHAHDDHCH